MSLPSAELRRRGLWLLKPCTRRMIGLLSHQDQQLRGEAARALGQIGDQEAVVPLIEALRRQKQDEQMAPALAEIGDESALEPLLEAFAQTDREIRSNIALALGAFRDSRAVQVLVSGLGDPDPNVRFACVSALGRLRDPASVSPLLGCLGESNEWIFLNVVDSLALIGDQRASNPLVAFYLKEPNERKRASIITALGRLRDLTVVPTLNKALRDSDDRVKANAIESLKQLELPPDKLAGMIHPFLKHADNRVRGNAIVALAKAPNVDLGAIFESMKEDSDKWTRATLGYILSVVEHPRAMGYIQTLLQDEDSDVKKNAARALSVRARDDQTEVLIQLLKDPTPFVRQQAVQTLGRIRSAAAIPVLTKLFAMERNFKIRSAIMSSFGQIGDHLAVPLLTQGLADRDSRVRANAVEALEQILGERSLDLLRPMVRDSDNRTRSNAAKALFRIGDVTVLAQLEEMIQEQDSPTRLSALYALGQIGLSLRELEQSPLLTSLKTSLTQTELQPVPALRSSVSDAAGTRVEDTLGREAWRNQFQEYFSAGRLREALTSCEAFLQQYPDDLPAVFFAGNLNFQLGRFEPAITLFKRVMEMDAQHIQALSSLGIAYYRLGRTQEAIHSFRQALQARPDLASLRFNLANLLLKENDIEEAIRQYEEGMKFQKPSPRILANAAFAYQRSGQYEKAIQHYRTSLAADPRDPGVSYNLAVILARQGKTDDARTILYQALKQIPPGAAGLKMIRELLERLKR